MIAKFVSIIKAIASIALVLTFAGCAGISAPPETPEKVVMARAQARWDALVAGQLEKSFEFITPSGRSTLPMDIYKGRLAGAHWKAAKVTAATCEPEICEVTVILDIDVLPNLPHKQPITEKWLLDGGKWWFVYRG